MKYLKSLWSEKVPNYNSEYHYLFEKLANKGNDGGNAESRVEDRGRIFATQYELYLFAFFLGLYSKCQKESKNKMNFGHKISEWGKKSKKVNRDSFAEIQDFVFISLVTFTEIDFIQLERSDSEDDLKKAIAQLIELMETFTNGGLQLIEEKIESNENYFIQSNNSPLNFFTEKSQF